MAEGRRAVFQADVAGSRLLDASEVADLLGIKRRTVYSLVDQGLLSYKRVGKRLVRFGQDDLEELYRRSRGEAP